jgi:hypothetical protein
MERASGAMLGDYPAGFIDRHCDEQDRDPAEVRKRLDSDGNPFEVSCRLASPCGDDRWWSTAQPCQQRELPNGSGAGITGPPGPPRAIGTVGRISRSHVQIESSPRRSASCATCAIASGEASRLAFERPPAWPGVSPSSEGVLDGSGAPEGGSGGCRLIDHPG